MTNRRDLMHRATRFAAAGLTGLLALALATPAHANPPWRGKPPQASNPPPGRGAPAPAPQPTQVFRGTPPAPRPAPQPTQPFRATPPPPQPAPRPLPPGHGGTPPGQWKKHHHHGHDRDVVLMPAPAPAPVYVAPAPAPAPHVHVMAPPPPVVQVQIGAPPPPAPVYVAPAPPPPPPHHHGGPVSITGTVRAPNGYPISGIMMVLAGTSEGRAVTDGAGRYAFYGLRPGSYAVRPNGPCGFGPDVVNLNNLHHAVVQDFNANCR